MNREHLIEAGIDYETGVYRFAGKEQLYEKFLMKFMNEPYLEQLEEQMLRGDIKEAFLTAHTMKGVLGTLGMTGLYETECAVVEALRAGNKEEADLLMEPLREEYRKIIRVLQKNCGVTND